MAKHIDTTRPVDDPAPCYMNHARHVLGRKGEHAANVDPLRSDGTAPSLPHRPDPVHAYIADAFSYDPDRTTRRGDTSPVYYPGRH